MLAGELRNKRKEHRIAEKEKGSQGYL